MKIQKEKQRWEPWNWGKFFIDPAENSQRKKLFRMCLSLSVCENCFIRERSTIFPSTFLSLCWWENYEKLPRESRGQFWCSKKILHDFSSVVARKNADVSRSTFDETTESIYLALEKDLRPKDTTGNCFSRWWVPRQPCFNSEATDSHTTRAHTQKHIVWKSLHGRKKSHDTNVISMLNCHRENLNCGRAENVLYMECQWRPKTI